MGCDVTRLGAEVIKAVVDGPHASFSTGTSARFPGLTTYAIDPRVAALSGTVALIASCNVARAIDGKDVDRAIVVNDRGDEFDTGAITSGQHAVGIWADVDRFHVAWITGNGLMLGEAVLKPDMTLIAMKTGPSLLGGTSQGIANYTRNGVEWRDHNNFVRLGGVGFSRPMTVGNWTVGLHGDPNWVLLFDHREQQVLVCRRVATDKACRLVADVAGNPVIAVTGAQMFLTLADFVPYAASQPPPDPQPNDPEPEPDMPLPDESAIFARIEQLRATYDAVMTDDDCVELLNRVAWEFSGVGLYDKDGGNHGVRYDNERFSIDYLVTLPPHPPRMADVFEDAGVDPGHIGKTEPQQFSWRELNAEDNETPEKFGRPIEPRPTEPPPGGDDGNGGGAGSDPEDDDDDDQAGGGSQPGDGELLKAYEAIIAALKLLPDIFRKELSESDKRLRADLPKMIREALYNELRNTEVEGGINASVRILGNISGNTRLKFVDKKSEPPQ